MRRASPLWIGWLGLILASIFTAQGSYVHVAFFIVPMLILLGVGIERELEK